MENQPIIENQPGLEMPEMKESHTLLAVIISVVVTAAIAGGGVYFWQNMESKEAESTVPESTSVQTTIVKPTVTSPQNWATVESALDGVKIAGKAAPNSSVWLFQVSEMDAYCLHLASALTLGDRPDANGNFEIDYIPEGDEESWPSEFAVVAIDESQKYQLRWVTGSFCAPEEATSDYFHWTLKQTATPVLFQDDAYHFRIIGTSKSCEDYYDIKVETTDVPAGALKAYSVFAPGSKSWPQGFSTGTYVVYTQEAYNKLPSDSLPGKPRIIFSLENGDVIVRWDPQDSPSDMPQGCKFNFERF